MAQRSRNDSSEKPEPRSSALRMAGENMLGAPKSPPAVPKTASFGVDVADSGKGLVKRNVVKPGRHSTIQDARPRGITDSLFGHVVESEKVRMKLYSFKSADADATISVGIAGAAVLKRRRSIELGADLPQLRANICADACSALAFSPDSGQLAGGFCDGFLRVFDSQSGAEELAVALPHLASSISPPSVTNLRWRPSGDGPAILASTDNAGVVCLWQMSSDNGKALECVFKTEVGTVLNAVCFTADRKKVAVAGADRAVRIYDIQEGSSGTTLKSVMEPFQHGTAIENKSASGGNFTFSGAAVAPELPQEEPADRPLENKGASSFMCGHKGPIVCLQADPVNPNLLFSGGIGRMILRWDLRVGGNAVGMIRGPRLSGDSMDISNDGQKLLTGSHRGDNPLEIYDLRELSSASSILVDPCTTLSWKKDATAKGGSCMLFGVAWDSDTNKTIAAAGENENLAKAFTREEDAEQNLCTIGTLECKGGHFLSVAAAPNGSRVAFGNMDGSVHLARLE